VIRARAASDILTTTACRKGVAVGTRTYEIRVAGALGPAGRRAFSDVSIAVEPSVTVLTAHVAQSGLHALLDRVRDLGLELIDIKQTPGGAAPERSRLTDQESPTGEGGL
jgi:hypothetical protein